MTDYDQMIDRTGGEALIPEDVSREIVQGAIRQSAALTLFRRVTMSQRQHRMPVLSVLPTAYWVDGDTGLKKTSQQQWANKYLTAEELAVIVPVPEAFLEDVTYDLWAEVMPRITEAIGALVDAAVFFGTSIPTSWPDSIVDGAYNAGNNYVRGSVSGQNLDVDISETMALVEGDGFDVTGFAARPRIRADLRGLRDADGQPILGTDSNQSTVYGEPLAYVNNGSWEASEADLIAGDFSQGIMGIRTDIQFKILTEAALFDDSGNLVINLPQQDSVALRARFRCGYQVPNPINVEQPTEANRYPFAVLNPSTYGS